MQKFAKKLCKAQIQKIILMKIQTQMLSGSSINVFFKKSSLFSEYNPLCGVSVRFKKPSSVFVVLYTIRVSLFVRRPPQMRGARARCHNTRKSAVVYRICRETDVCLYIPTSCISLYEYHLPQCIIDT